MKKIYWSIYIIVLFIILSCSWDSDPEDKKVVWIPGTYTMIEVPVPQGGITFPIGYDDDGTATINNAYYLGETQITCGLWQAVAYWATFEKKGEYYDFIYWSERPYLPNPDNPNLPRIYYPTWGKMDYPMWGVTYLQVLVWCNAYTEWHNQIYGTNYTPVYINESGTPIRSAKEPYDPSTYNFSTLQNYLNNHPKMQEYIRNVETSGTGFRLPTPEEWELAARWRGSDDTNTVKGIVNGIDFSIQPIKFTKGNSVSGGSDNINNLNECNKYAVFEYNSKANSQGYGYTRFDLRPPKTKMPNALNIYDMSGNLREFVYYVRDFNLRGYDYPFVQTRGGYYEDNYSNIAIGGSIYVDIAAYNHYYGVRIARSK